MLASFLSSSPTLSYIQTEQNLTAHLIMIKIFFSEILHMSSTQNDSAQFKDPMCCSIKLIGICPDLCVCITPWELMLHILKNMSHFKSCFFSTSGASLRARNYSNIKKDTSVKTEDTNRQIKQYKGACKWLITISLHNISYLKHTMWTNVELTFVIFSHVHYRVF